MVFGTHSREETAGTISESSFPPSRGYFHPLIHVILVLHVLSYGQQYLEIDPAFFKQ
jgi:hypothetical protein